MKKVMLLILINLVLSVFQTAFFPELLGVSFAPNLIFAFALAIFTLRKTETAFMSSLIGGVLIDLLTDNLIGISPLVFTFVLLFLTKLLPEKNYSQSNFLTFVKTLLFVFLSFFLYQLVTTLPINTDAFLETLSSIVTSSLSSLAVYMIFKFVLEKTLSNETSFRI